MPQHQNAQTVPTGFESVFYEGFDYSSGSDLRTQTGGTGFTSGWGQFYQDKYLTVGSSGYSYPNLITTGLRAQFDNTCYGNCNDISASGRQVTAVTEGVLYLQFLANFGTQGGGGTPHLRLNLNGSTVVIIGSLEGNNLWELKDVSSNSSSSSTYSKSVLRFVIVRFDYDNGTMKMWVDPDLSTFDYSNPLNPQASIANITTPSFDEIGIMFRSNGTPGIDEIHAFKSPSEIPVVDRYGRATTTPGSQLNQYGQVGVGNSFVNKNGKIITF